MAPVIVLLVALQHSVAAFVLGGIWVVALLLVGNGPAPQFLARSLQGGLLADIPPSNAKRRAIVLMGDGTIEHRESGRRVPGWFAISRIEKAAEIYHAAAANGSASEIIITGDDSVEREEPPAYAKRLMALGVPATDIRIEARGRNTYQQAEFTKAILDAGKCDEVFLVTSGLHMRRALLYFGNVGVNPTPVPSDYVSVAVTLAPNGYNFAITDIAVHQYVGIARMHVYNALGWNRRQATLGGGGVTLPPAHKSQSPTLRP